LGPSITAAPFGVGETGALDAACNAGARETRDDVLGVGAGHLDEGYALAHVDASDDLARQPALARDRGDDRSRAHVVARPDRQDDLDHIRDVGRAGLLGRRA